MVGNANANGIPFLKRYGIPPAIKNSMILWYDIAKQGATNESMAENPILKDLSGNGHDATCYNFAWSGMSGIGGYKVNFDDFLTSGDESVIEKTYNKLIVYNTKDVNTNFWDFLNNLAPGEVYHQDAYKVRISGLSDDETIQYIYYNFDDNNSLISTNIYLRNGINTIPEINMTSATGIINSYSTIFQYVIKPHTDKQITLELIPEYPNALVSDGVDDYAYVEGLPILTDYTVIAKRKWLDDTKRGAIATKFRVDGTIHGAFAFEFINIEGNKKTINFGSYTDIVFEVNDISWQTKKSYNDNPINKGNLYDTELLNLFTVRPKDGYTKTVLYSFVLFNRTLTENEIKKWIRINIDKDYLLDTNEVN